ncbi:MAG: hypothetical protein JXR88_01925 [Clostridia bacterium]|nr:hypothetical protein [Clostridia bacterium]
MKRSQNTIEITSISISIAAVIGGGLALYLTSSMIPIPGFKYIMLSPLLSLTIYILQRRITKKSTILKFGLTFSFLMSVINLYMGLAIFITTVLTYLTQLIIRWQPPIISGIFFSFYTGFVSLLISKYLIGGIFQEITLIAMGVVGLFCSLFGWIGVVLGHKVYEHIILNKRF